MFVFLRKQPNPPEKQEDAKTLTSSVLYGLGEPFSFYGFLGFMPFRLKVTQLYALFPCYGYCGSTFVFWPWERLLDV